MTPSPNGNRPASTTTPRPPRDINLQVALRDPPDEVWMREYLDIYLDDRNWPAVVSSSAIEDLVLAKYPRWKTRIPRLHRIITRALHAAGYTRRSVQGKSWDRAGAGTRDVPTCASEEGTLIKVGE